MLDQKPPCLFALNAGKPPEGMIQEYKGTLFCSKGCVSAFKKESESGGV